jgi:predicted nucleic acid-binding Zn ribbon protein
MAKGKPGNTPKRNRATTQQRVMQIIFILVTIMIIASMALSLIKF